MNKLIKFAVAGCSVLLLSQCATQDEVRDLQYQLRAVNQKVEDVKSNAVGKMQRRQANSVSQLGAVADETSRIKAALEENAAITQQFRDQTRESVTSLQSAIDATRSEQDAKLEALSERIKVLEERLSEVNENISKVQKERLLEAERRVKEAAAKAEEAKKRAREAAKARPQRRSSYSSSTSSTADIVQVSPGSIKTRIATNPAPERTVSSVSAEPKASQRSSSTTTALTTAPEKSEPSVTPPPRQEAPKAEPVARAEAAAPAEHSSSDPAGKAMGLFQSKKYKEAYKAFEQELAVDPNGPQAGKILYHMGECLYNQGEYDLAILDYQKVISNHGSSSLTPSALLKQGMSFEKLTDHETAKIIYKKLIGDFGSSSEATTAKQRLGKL